KPSSESGVRVIAAVRSLVVETARVAADQAHLAEPAGLSVTKAFMPAARCRPWSESDASRITRCTTVNRPTRLGEYPPDASPPSPRCTGSRPGATASRPRTRRILTADREAHLTRSHSH